MSVKTRKKSEITPIHTFTLELMLHDIKPLSSDNMQRKTHFLFFMYSFRIRDTTDKPTRLGTK